MQQLSIPDTALTQGANKIFELKASQDKLYFAEYDSDLARCSVYTLQDGNKKDLLPIQYSIKSSVNEYGGDAYTVSADNQIFFSNKCTNIFQIKSGSLFQITNDEYSYTNINYVHDGLLAVVEDKKQHQMYIAHITMDGVITCIHSEHDFYCYLSYLDGKITFVGWDNPNMPWDNTSLYYGSYNNKQIVVKKLFSNVKASYVEPKLIKSLDEVNLLFISDHDGFWKLYKSYDGNVKPVLSDDYDHSYPHWIYGISSYAGFYKDTKLHVLARRYNKSFGELSSNGNINFDSQGCDFNYFVELKNKIYAIVSFVDKSDAILEFDISASECQTLYSLPTHEYNFLKPKNIEFSTSRTVYGLLYLPNCIEPPPLIVKAHGGPTAQAMPSLDMKVQFWVSLGFAFLDIDYTGSSGYGRDYRNMLYGNAGIYDVEDCIAATEELVLSGVVSNKVFFRGSSAGGHILLQALTKTDIFTAAACYYGISDLNILLNTTHRFEEFYTKKLYGENENNHYYNLSPINYVSDISTPVIFFHGTNDKVVPASMSKTMHNKMQESQYYEFNEGHGFRKSENICSSINLEYSFYKKYLNI